MVNRLFIFSPDKLPCTVINLIATDCSSVCVCVYTCKNSLRCKERGGCRCVLLDHVDYVTGPLSRDATEADVQDWLEKVCGLPPESLSQFECMDGKTLFSYADFESVLKDVDISYGKARTILFQRDFPDRQSEMLRWTVKDVQDFVHQKLEKPKLNLQMFSEKDVDGVVLMSFTDGGELKRDLGLNGVIARRIFEERNAFIAEEVTVGSEETDALVQVAGKSVESVLEEQNVKQHEEPSTVLDETDVSAAHKMFVQDTLHLQHLHLPIEFDLNTLEKASLKIVRVKENRPSVLDKTILFFVLHAPDFQTKKALPYVWKMIKNRTQDLWKAELEEHLKGRGTLQVENTKLLLNGQEIEFSKVPTPALVHLVEFDKDVKKCYREYPVPVLLVDKQLLKKQEDSHGRPGYSCKLGGKRDSPVYHFGFEKDRKYWCFDSDDFSASIVDMTIPESQAGQEMRCTFEWQKPVEEETTVLFTEDGDKKIPNEQSEPVSVSDTENLKQESVAEQTLVRLISKQGNAKYIPPRDFKNAADTCKPYVQGQCLDVLESAHGMINRSVELKYYEAEQDANKEIFLLKALKFVCGCLNSRRNGTIFFGVPEGDSKNEHFEYGEIQGVNLKKPEQDDYYKAFHKHLDRCFLEHDVVRKCVHGPYFVRVKSSSESAPNERCVIEIDIEPYADVCQTVCFSLDASQIGKNLKKETGMYLRDTGFKDGTVQTRRLLRENEGHFYSVDLPALVEQRQKEETSWERQRKMKVNSEGSKLRRFMENCDDSVCPMLVVSRATESVRETLENCLKFVKFIPWAAVFDFDCDSEKDGLFHVYNSSPSEKKATRIHAKDFAMRTVEKQKEQFNMSSDILWFFANGNAMDDEFEHLDYRDWLRKYYPCVKDAITFLQNPCVISRQRHHVLVLVSAETEDDVVKTVDDLASFSNIGLDRMFFVFDHAYIQKMFISKSIYSSDVEVRSSVLLWQDVGRIINQVLDLEQKGRHKNVVTASQGLAQIPPHQWMAWTDLSVVSATECEDIEERSELEVKASQEEIRFYRGGQVSWFNFYFPKQVMERSIQQEVEEQLVLMQSAESNENIPKVMIYHMPGTGGTTLGKQLLWKRRKQNKCAVIDRITQNTFKQICEFWEAGELCLKEEWKPVILLSDNNTADDVEVTESALCAKLFRHQKREGLSKPIAVLVVCRRSVGHGSDGFHLKQKLSDAREKMWMETTYKRLEGKKLTPEIKTFLGFLAIRHEFDPAKLEQIVLPYLSDDGLSQGERDLIVYIALIMKYFPPSMGRPGIPVSSFDGLLSRKQPWDRDVSDIANVILVREHNPVIKARIVRLANIAVADAILGTIKAMDELTLADIMISCLHSSLISELDQCEAYGSSLTIKIMRAMLIERFTEDGSKMTMSPLILDIVKESELESAAHILELGHQQLGGAVFYQQLARLYTNYEMFDKAVESGKKALSMCGSDNAEFTHTLGFVYLKYFQHLASGNDKGVEGEEEEEEAACNEKVHGEIQHHRKVIHVAIQSFMNLTDAQACKDAITKSYACCDKIKIINALLHYIIKKLLLPENYTEFGCFLMKQDVEIEMFENFPELETTVKDMLTAGVEALRYMYNFGFSHKNSSHNDVTRRDRSRFPVSYTTSECIKQCKAFATSLKTVIPTPRRHTHVQDLSSRIENLKLRGSFFESIFYFVLETHQQHSQEKKRHLRQCADLQQIKANLENIKKKTTEDMDNYISVCLAIDLIRKAEGDCQLQHQRSTVYQFCNDIIEAGDDVRTMRAHLFRVLVCWPTWKESEMFSTHHFLVSFHNKGSFLESRGERLFPRVHFFVAKLSACFHLCHWTEIFKPKQNYVTSRRRKGQSEQEKKEEEEEDNIEEEVTATMHSKLQPFHGSYKEDRSVVEFNMGEFSNKLEARLTIRALRGKKVFTDAEVWFYLGFSLQGPTAYVYDVLPAAEKNP